MRNPGPYYVRFAPDHGWTVAQWTGEYWLVIGSDKHAEDSFWHEIGEPVLPPGESTNVIPIRR